MGLFILIYWIGERLYLVPSVVLEDFPIYYYDAYTFKLNKGEVLISLVFLSEISWVGLWILWFKITGHKIEW